MRVWWCVCACLCVVQRSIVWYMVYECYNSKLVDSIEWSTWPSSYYNNSLWHYMSNNWRKLHTNMTSYYCIFIVIIIIIITIWGLIMHVPYSNLIGTNYADGSVSVSVFGIIAATPRELCLNWCRAEDRWGQGEMRYDPLRSETALHVSGI